MLQLRDYPHPLSVHTRRSPGWLLVATQHASGRGLPHHGARRTSTSTRLVRGPGGRQHRHWPTSRGVGGIRSPRTAQYPEHLPHARVHPASQVRIGFTYKHCRVKLYLKEGCALRIEMVVNDPGDLDILKGLAHLEPPAPKRRGQGKPGEASRHRLDVGK